MNIQPSTGLITGTITNTAAENSPYPVQVTVSDGKPLGSTTIGFEWTVDYINLSPSLQNPGNQFDQVDEIISLQIKTTDPDGDAYQFTAIGLPPSLVIDPNMGIISGKLAELDALSSPHTVTITATDDGTPNKSSKIDFIWVVTAGEIYLPLILH